MAALLALAIGLTGGSSGFYAVLALAFYGALATANADTWATESAFWHAASRGY